MEKIDLTGSKEEVFNEVAEYLKRASFQVVNMDKSRPWGGFFVIDEAQTEQFIEKYFPEINPDSINKGGKLSPKILLVQKHKRLSWQYHHRRAEIWKLVSGSAGVIASKTDQEGPVNEIKSGGVVKLDQGERHRLVGLDGWGVIAEIWQHTDPNNPSDEEDIVRVQDDFGR